MARRRVRAMREAAQRSGKARPELLLADEQVRRSRLYGDWRRGPAVMLPPAERIPGIVRGERPA